MSEREQAGGLDDLFAMVAEPGPEESPVPVERPRSRVLWVTRNLLLVAVATVVTVAVLRSVRLSVSVLVVAAAFAALRLLMLAVAEVAPPPAPKPAGRRTTADTDGLFDWAGTDSLRSAVRQWEQRLEWSRSDPDAFARNVLPVLGELADERLRLHHGITRASDPSRARELLGEPLWRALGEPRRQPLQRGFPGSPRRPKDQAPGVAQRQGFPGSPRRPKDQAPGVAQPRDLAAYVETLERLGEGVHR